MREVEGSLLAHIARNPRASRAALVATTGLSRNTVGKRLDEFVRLGLVVERLGASVGGRPPMELTLNPKAGVVLAADLGATQCSLDITDLGGNLLAAQSYEISIGDGPSSVLEEVDRRFRVILESADRSPHDVLALGIGVPGPVEHSTGTVVRPPIMPSWDGYAVPGFFADRYDAPTLVDNDVNLAALGEYWMRNESVEDLLYVKMSTGIGCGIVSKGRLHRGAEGAAGDIGHIRIPGASETVCVCGKVGCLEAVAGGDAIARKLRDLGVSEAHNARDVALLAASGNPLAKAAVREASDKLGEVLASLVSFYNPNAIVIGGPLAEVDEEPLAAVRTAIYQLALPLATRALRVETSLNSAAVGTLGARAMALDVALSPAGVKRLRRRAR
jgi:predicted NBD/HSP70 family sugar kinase